MTTTGGNGHNGSAVLKSEVKAEPEAARLTRRAELIRAQLEAARARLAEAERL